MEKEEKIKFLKERGWKPVWTDKYWTNMDLQSNMGGLPIDTAYDIEKKKETKKLLRKLGLTRQFKLSSNLNQTTTIKEL